MRTLILGAFLAVAAAPALAEPCRTHRHAHYARYHHHHHHHRGVRSYRYRHYRGRAGYFYRRSFVPSDRYYGYGRGHYGFRAYRSHGCSPYVYRGFHRGIRLAPIYGRLSTVFTLDDDVFDGDAKEASDGDGLPRARTKPVGARFLQ